MYYPFYQLSRRNYISPEKSYWPPIQEISNFITEYIWTNEYDRDKLLFIGSKQMTLETAQDLFDNR